MDLTPFARRTWVDGRAGGTPADAASLNRLEQGLWNVTEVVRGMPLTLTATVATASPLTIDVGDLVAPATRLAGYTPVVGHSVKATLLASGWVVEDRVMDA